MNIVAYFETEKDFNVKRYKNDENGQKTEVKGLKIVQQNGCVVKYNYDMKNGKKQG